MSLVFNWVKIFDFIPVKKGGTVCKKSYQFLSLILSFLLFVSGCVTSSSKTKSQSESLTIVKSLPQSKLAFYNDSFDNLREDVWEEETVIWSEEQLSNLKLAEMSIENGKLKIETKTGGFSKNGLISKYTLIGDFDIQIDCHIVFLESLYNMEQILAFIVTRAKKRSEKDKSPGTAVFSLRKRPKKKPVFASGFISPEGRYDPFPKFQYSGDFDGTLRIVRIGHTIITLYKRKGELEWTIMHNFQGMTEAVRISFVLQNFFGGRFTDIGADSSIYATFDNFRINAAQGIMEDEI